MINAVVPFDRLEDETVEWCETICKRSPMAVRMIKRGLNAELDGQRGLMELAGDATLMFYLMEEAQEGKNAFSKKETPILTSSPNSPVDAYCNFCQSRSPLQIYRYNIKAVNDCQGDLFCKGHR